MDGIFSITTLYDGNELIRIQVKFYGGKHGFNLSKTEAFHLADFINAIRLTPHPADAAGTAAGDGDGETRGAADV